MRLKVKFKHNLDIAQTMRNSQCLPESLRKLRMALDKFRFVAATSVLVEKFVLVLAPLLWVVVVNTVVLATVVVVAMSELNHSCSKHQPEKLDFINSSLISKFD